MYRYLIHQAVSQSAQARPDAEALRLSGKSITYAELEARTNALARLLRDLGVQRGDRVGIYVNKSLESAIAIYGILKSGGAYVPLDPFAPPARLGFVIRDCGIRWIITAENKVEGLAGMLGDDAPVEHLIGIEAQEGLTQNCIPWEQVNQVSAQALPEIGLTEQDLAYILYTSGSTGTPKGIMHTHRSGLSFAEWAVITYGVRAEDRVSSHAPLHFDLSTFDFFASAIAGACVVIIPEALTKFPASLSKLIETERISVWYSVPFALIQLLERGVLEQRDLSSMRWILFAGEVFPTKHLREVMKAIAGARFSNLYGPTETNVCTFYHVPQLPEDNDETIPIGIACENIESLVVDSDDKPVAPGEVGELLIRGGVVMRGYWNQAEKTAAGFYRRPALGFLDDIFYRTGDLVQLDAEGNFRYLGRKDRQIKTRGYRVELDEVEVALLSHPNVHEAAAYPVPDGQGSNLIEASLVLHEAGEQNAEAVEQIIAHISNRLPPYAVPAHIDVLPDFPRTSTGKINRRELQSRATERAKKNQ